VLVRADGLPLYNFSCAVDDHQMGITLVARGDDHMLNTPIQILLHRAMGASPPEFAHLSMILDEKGKKMSKRAGAGSVEDYQDRGFVPDAVLNYLARLGWSHGDEELFDRDELIAKFDFAHVGKEGARYDERKFAHVQAHHLRKLPTEALVSRSLPFIRARGLEVDDGDPRLGPAIETVRQRATTLEDVAEMVDYYFREPPVADEKATRKFLKPKFLEPVTKLRALLETVEAWERESLEKAVEAWMETEELGFKHFAQAVRVSLSGRSATPGLFEVLEVVGRERSLSRLDAGLAVMRARAEDAGS
jgi:glutamyl-tRNA synthetase